MNSQKQQIDDEIAGVSTNNAGVKPRTPKENRENGFLEQSTNPFAADIWAEKLLERMNDMRKETMTHAMKAFNPFAVEDDSLKQIELKKKSAKQVQEEVVALDHESNGMHAYKARTTTHAPPMSVNRVQAGAAPLDNKSNGMDSYKAGTKTNAPPQGFQIKFKAGLKKEEITEVSHSHMQFHNGVPVGMNSLIIMRAELTKLQEETVAAELGL